MLFHKALLTTKVLQSSSSSLESRESVHAAIYFFNTLISAVCLRLNLRNAFLVFRVGVMGALVACVLALFSYIPLLFYFSLFLLFPRQSTSAHISQFEQHMPYPSSPHLSVLLFHALPYQHRCYFTGLLISLYLKIQRWNVFQILQFNFFIPKQRSETFKNCVDLNMLVKQKHMLQRGQVLLQRGHEFLYEYSGSYNEQELDSDHTCKTCQTIFRTKT